MLVLEKDNGVFGNLLTTGTYYLYHGGENETMQAASDRIQRKYEHSETSTGITSPKKIYCSTQIFSAR